MFDYFTIVNCWGTKLGGRACLPRKATRIGCAEETVLIILGMPSVLPSSFCMFDLTPVSPSSAQSENLQFVLLHPIHIIISFARIKRIHFLRNLYVGNFGQMILHQVWRPQNRSLKSDTLVVQWPGWWNFGWFWYGGRGQDAFFEPVSFEKEETRCKKAYSLLCQSKFCTLSVLSHRYELKKRSFDVPTSLWEITCVHECKFSHQNRTHLNESVWLKGRKLVP